MIDCGNFGGAMFCLELLNLDFFDLSQPLKKDIVTSRAAAWSAQLKRWRKYFVVVESIIQSQLYSL